MIGDVQQAVEQSTKHAMDVASYGVVGASLIGWLPNIAAGFSVIWIIYQLSTSIYDRVKKNKDQK